MKVSSFLKRAAVVAVGVAAVFAAGGARAATYYVATNGDDGNPGTEELPLKTINAAVTGCAAEGGTVYVASGDYSVSAQISLTNATKIVGRTGKPEDVRIVLPKKVAYPLKLNHRDALVASASISGAAFGCTYAYGAGARIDVNGGTVSNCVIHSCKMTSGWGASGAGAYLCSDDAVLTHCVITNNIIEAGNTGVGSVIRMEKGLVRNCLVAKNGTTDYVGTSGYAVYATGGRIEHSTFVENQDYTSAAVYASGKSTRVVNCLCGAGRTRFATASPSTNGTASCFVNCLVGEDLVLDAASGNYQPCAAAVNAGAALEWITNGVDLAGNPRLAGGEPDIGCYEKRLTFVDVTPSVSAGAAPLAVTFAVRPLSGGTADYTCEWDWNGDGTYEETTAGTTSHPFAAGTWNVKVKITDNSAKTSWTSDAMPIRVSPKTIYVRKESSTPVAPYADWDSAAKTLEAAVSVAAPNAEIVVSNGTHTLTKVLTLDSAVKIRGLTGNPSDITLKAAKDTRHFVLMHPDLLLSGLTLTGGAPAANYQAGGSIRIVDRGGCVSNCVFSGNTATGWGAYGGAIHLTSATGLIDRCTFTGNISKNNEGSAGGHAVCMSAGTMRNCLVVDNGITDNTSNKGGSVYASGGRVENCSFNGNKAYKVPGVYAEAKAVIVNCALGKGEGGAGVSNPTNLYFAGTAACFTNCACPVAINEGHGCIVTNGLFRNAAAGDYYPGGDVLDLAAPLDWMTGGLDLAGFARISGEAADIGCYELQQAFVKVSADKASGLTPLKVTYTVKPSKACTAGILCEWDWNNDGTFDDTSDGTTNHVFSAGDYNVNVRVTDLKTGETWEPDVPFPLSAVDPSTEVGSAADLAAAIDKVFDGCEIVISNGTYTLTGVKTIDKAITIRSRSDDPTNVVLKAKASSRHFILNNAQATLSGLTLQDGAPSGNYESAGSVRIEVSGGKVVDCIFKDNSASGWDARGGAIEIKSDQGFVDRCIFTGNISKTSTSIGGHAVYMTAGTLRNSLVVNNGDTYAFGNSGGAVWATGGRVENCSFAKNKAARISGVYAGANAMFVNCTLDRGTSQAVTYDTDPYYAGTVASFTNCACPIVINEGHGCIVTNELYRNAADEDYYPGNGTIDCAATLDWMEGSVDLAHAARISGDVPDIGCYELKASFVKVAADKQEGIAPTTVTFTVTPKASCTAGVSCQWDWNGDDVWDETTDGTTSHEFEEAGDYQVRVKVTDLATQDTYEPDVPFPVKVVNRRTDVSTAAELEAAVARAIDGCEIVVSNGLYNISAEQVLEKGVTVRGLTGCAEDVIVVNRQGAATRTNNRQFVLNHPEAKVLSLTLQGGRLEKEYSYGGSIRIQDNGGMVSNCLFRGSSVYGWDANGAAIHINSDAALVTHCVFTNNVCNGGPGYGIAYVKKGSVRNCLFTQNGMLTVYSSSARSYPICAVGGTAENCTVVDNTDYYEAGIYAAGTAQILNCLICSNVCGNGAVDARVYSGTAGCFSHCLSDVVKINSDCYQDDATKFFKNYAEKDFRLPAKSPAVGKGVVRPWMTGATDLLGKPRLIGRYPDIGAYECQSAGFTLIVR